MKKIASLMRRLWPDNATPPATVEPRVFPAPPDFSNRLNADAKLVLNKLTQQGYEAFLVGGCIRDILAGHLPKDFDVATNATPEQVYRTFKNSRLIGRRFRIVHVFFRSHIIEVSTFRASAQRAQQEVRRKKLHPKDATNIFGSIDEDAFRRDFSINALYFRLHDHIILDFTQGMHDLKQQCIRMIGDPTTRFIEDPVRLIRAIRLAAKLNFTLDEASQQALDALPDHLQKVAPSRLFDEVLKLFLSGYAQKSFQRLRDCGYFKVLFPSIAPLLDTDPHALALLDLTMQETDHRIATQQKNSSPYLLAALFWPAVAHDWDHNLTQNIKPYPALCQAIAKTFTQHEAFAISKRVRGQIKVIWLLQYYLTHRRKQRAFRILEHRNFRAGFHLLCSRSTCHMASPELATWWQTFYDSDHLQRQKLLSQLDKTPPP